jgi:hypothetical protein
MTNNNRQRRVHFEETLSVDVAEVEWDEEQEKRWYTSKDIAILRASYQKEQFFEERPTVKDFVHSFLAQQNEHQHLGIDDPRGLFQFSKACSKHSRKQALLQAQDNARESFCTKEDPLVDSIDQILGMLSTESFLTC